MNSAALKNSSSRSSPRTTSTRTKPATPSQKSLKFPKEAVKERPENILIPPTVQSSISGAAQFAFTDGTNQSEPVVLQQTLQITLEIDGQDINVPIDGMPDRNRANAIITSGGHEVWWPAVGSGDDECPLAKCVKVRVHFQDGGNLQYAFNVRLQSTSYSWWDDGRVDSRIAGKDIGINVDNSGTLPISQTVETVCDKPSLEAITGTTEVARPAMPSTPRTPW